MGPCQSLTNDSNHSIKARRQIPVVYQNQDNPTSKYDSKQVFNNYIKNRSEEEVTHENNKSHESCNSSNSILNSTASITLEATIQANDTLIFTKKGDPFSFTSVKGQWCILSEYGMTSYKGYQNIQSQQRNVCCLLFRILGGMTQMVEVGKVYIADSTGQIQFFPNIDENDVTFYNPKGYLEIKIKGTRKLLQNKIDSVCGWNNIKPSASPFLTVKENMIVDYINKIRSAPRLFSNLYLNANSAYKEIKEALLECTPISQLEVSEALTSTAQAHAKDIGESGITGHIGSDNSTLKERVTKHSNGRKIVYFGENSYYSSDNPLSLVIEMILDNVSIDKSNRLNILNPQFNSIGVSIYKHHAFKWCCIIVFGEII